MNHALKLPTLPALTVNFLQESGILRRAGFNKRSGFPVGEVIFTLSLWLWLKKDTIGLFARDRACKACDVSTLFRTNIKADAWFGSKAMLRLYQETALTAILRMKKNKMKYRFSVRFLSILAIKFLS